MDRRRFLLISLAGVLAAPLAAEAQPTGKVPRIAFLTTKVPSGSPTTDAFVHELRELEAVSEEASPALSNVTPPTAHLRIGEPERWAPAP
jgi:hypothetical protein